MFTKVDGTEMVLILWTKHHKRSIKKSSHRPRCWIREKYPFVHIMTFSTGNA